jgi:hypothetical protein
MTEANEQLGTLLTMDPDRVAHSLLWPRLPEDMMYVSQSLSGGDYLSCGAFLRRSIGPKGGGRTLDNCIRVTTLMWDADLVTLYEALLVARGRPVPPRRKLLKEQMYRLPMDQLNILRKILVDRFVPLWSDATGMVPTVTLDSGWGVHVHMAVEPEAGEQTEALAAVYADLTRRVNERVAAYAREMRPSLKVPTMFDRLTVGAQLARPPGTVNVKCPHEPKTVSVLDINPESAIDGNRLDELMSQLNQAGESLFQGLGPPAQPPTPPNRPGPQAVDFSQQYIDGRTWSEIAYSLRPGERLKVRCPFGGDSIGSGFFARETDGRTRYFSHPLRQTFWDTVVRQEAVSNSVVRLIMGKANRNGPAKPRNILQNLRLLLEGDEAFDLWWDDFSELPMDGDQEVGEEWWLNVRELMEQKYNWTWSVPERVLNSMMVSVAKQRSINKPRRWLDQLGAGWDGKQRLETWMHRAFGVPKGDKLLTEYSLRWPLCLVARMMEPGVKQDSMLITLGPQGCGKSTAFEVWVDTPVQPNMFVDTRVRLDDKDALMVLAKAWVYEDAELLAHAGAGAEARKSFLSSRTDTYRKPYARNVSQSKRHCVVVGSTNSSVFLSDVTGSRRYWVVPVDKVDLDWLRLNRDQLLGEAVNRWRNGEQWWLTPAAEKMQAKQNRRYLRSNSYCAAALALAETVRHKDACFTTEQCSTVLGIPIREHKQLTNGLEAAGWMRVRNNTRRGWTLTEDSNRTWGDRFASGAMAMAQLANIWSEMFRVPHATPKMPAPPADS